MNEYEITYIVPSGKRMTETLKADNIDEAWRKFWVITGYPKDMHVTLGMVIKRLKKSHLDSLLERGIKEAEETTELLKRGW